MLEVPSRIRHIGGVQVENDNRFHSLAVEDRSNIRRHAGSRRLSNVALNSRFHIERLEGPSEECHRLMDLGFTPGEEVAVTHAAPLGDPLVIRVRGALLALRKREAAWIWVR